MQVFFYQTPDLCPSGPLPDCAVVIDVLRATTTISAALQAGVEAVQVFADIETLMQASDQWPVEKRLRAGERGGQKLPAFDLGNSPLECTSARLMGRRLFMSTTNGTRTLHRVESAKVVLAAALVNRRRVVEYLLANRPQTLWLVASGWEGHFSLEDSVCAGAVAHSLAAGSEKGLSAMAGNDELIAAIALYRQWQNRLLKLLHHASHGQRLLRLGYKDDLQFCAQTDVLNILPVQKEPGLLISLDP
jgi:2-phosphosulfolactate phosphatase